MDDTTTDWQNRTDLDDSVENELVDLVLGRIASDPGVTREALHDWEIAHPQVIDGILGSFITSGNVMLVDGKLTHTRLHEFV